MNTNQPTSKAAERIAACLRLIIAPGQVFEIRAFPCVTKSRRISHTQSGYFDFEHINDAANAAVFLTDPRGANAGSVYLTLNPVLPDLLSRRANRVDFAERGFRATQDEEITARRWLLIDCDPVRPAGVSSTDSELESVRRVADKILADLTEAGWPTPITANSGNGRHILYRVDLPTDDSDLVKTCLRSLSAQFSTDAVSVDTKVFNPARICKLYGTFSRKGDSTETRPHRLSHIISAPSAEYLQSEAACVPIELLKILAAKAPVEAAHQREGRRREPPKNSVIARAKKYLDLMPESISGQNGHDKAYRAACELVRGFSLPDEDAFRLLQDFNDRCQPPWTEGELWHKIEQARKHADGQPGYLLTGGNSNITAAAINGSRDDDGSYREVEFAPFGLPVINATRPAVVAADRSPLALPLASPLADFDLVIEPQALPKAIPQAPQQPNIIADPPPDLRHDTVDRSIIEDVADPGRLARAFLSRRFTRRPSREITLRSWRQNYYQWHQHRWQKITDHTMKSTLTLWIDDEFASINEKMLANPDPQKAAPTKKAALLGTIENVDNFLRALTILDDEIDTPSFIGGPFVGCDPLRFVAVKNGLVDLQNLCEVIAPAESFDPTTFADFEIDPSLDPDADLIRTPSLTVIPNTPQFFNLTCLPVAYDPAATAPRWEAFLDKNLQGNEEEILLLQQWFGYCLTPDTRLHKFLMLEGDGRNGKSVVCAVLRALLGDDSVSSVSLESMADTRMISSLEGKLANIVGDMGEVSRVAEGILKSLVSGEKFSIDQKYKSTIHIEPKARLMFATNVRPRFTDRSSGIWRRLILLPITHVVSDDEVVLGMDYTPYWQDELSGILNWALAGLASLRRMGRFIEPESCRLAKDDYQTESNPTRDFLTQTYAYSSDEAWTVPCARVYEAYKHWCQEFGYHPLNERNFGKEVRVTFNRIAAGRGNVERVLRGSREQREWTYTHLKPITENTFDFGNL